MASGDSCHPVEAFVLRVWKTLWGKVYSQRIDNTWFTRSDYRPSKFIHFICLYVSYVYICSESIYLGYSPVNLLQVFLLPSLTLCFLFSYFTRILKRIEKLWKTWPMQAGFSTIPCCSYEYTQVTTPSLCKNHLPFGDLIRQSVHAKRSLVPVMKTTKYSEPRQLHADCTYRCLCILKK